MVGFRSFIAALILLSLPVVGSTQEKKPKKPAPIPATRATPVPQAADVKKPGANKSDSNILFEGYSKVILGGTHVGFVVQRYEFNPTKKEFASTYLLKTNALAGGVTESLKARCSMGFKPLSYQYTELVDGKSRTIDANFQNNVMLAVVTKQGEKPVTIRKDLPKGAFLSTFLVYVMMNGKEGLKTGVRYGFNAVAEEDAGIYPGEATIAAQEQLNGMTVFKVFNSFKGTRFASYVNTKGDVLSTRSPVQSIATELVGTLQEATQGQSFNPSTLSLLFGNVPEGKANALVRKDPSPPMPPAPPEGTAPKTESTVGAGNEDQITEEIHTGAASETTPPAPPPRTKGEGIQPGKGVILKGASPKTNPETQPETNTDTNKEK